MTTILLLETATEVCSAAVYRDGRIMAAKETIEGYNHSEKLTVFIEDLMEENNIPMVNLDAVCVSRGPGSYTGLRIGVSVAKGICYALRKPLISVGTLEALASQVAHHPQDYGLTLNSTTLLCPLIDARRMEVYTALYDYTGTPITGIEARIIDENSYTHELANREVIFFGNGAAKCRLALNHPNARFPGEVHASARFMSALACNRYNLREFEDVAYFEPFYLKDFVATIPKNKLF
jgi:tRNA threonylcarbamoyladenosine biosynthesis protein TsaB